MESNNFILSKLIERLHDETKMPVFGERLKNAIKIRKWSENILAEKYRKSYKKDILESIKKYKSGKRTPPENTRKNLIQLLEEYPGQWEDEEKLATYAAYKKIIYDEDIKQDDSICIDNKGRIMIDDPFFDGEYLQLLREDKEDEIIWEEMKIKFCNLELIDRFMLDEYFDIYFSISKQEWLFILSYGHLNFFGRTIIKEALKEIQNNIMFNPKSHSQIEKYQSMIGKDVNINKSILSEILSGEERETEKFEKELWISFSKQLKQLSDNNCPAIFEESIIDFEIRSQMDDDDWKLLIAFGELGISKDSYGKKEMLIDLTYSMAINPLLSNIKMSDEA